MKTVRRIALEQLVRWEEEKRYLPLSLAHVAREDRAALTALLYTTVEHLLTLDYHISALAGRSDIDPVTRCILRLGLCQIEYMDHIPPHAAVNETVALARHRGEAAFVNAVLREAIRSPEKLALPPREKNELRYLSLRHSVPLPTLRLIDAALGRAETEAYLSACERDPGLTLTVNRLRKSREEVLAALREHGFDAAPSPLTDGSVCLPRSVPVADLPGFAEGDFFVQDAAACLAVETLAPRPGDFVIDVCAAPGGKSFAAASLVGDRGRVAALELHESKLGLIADGAARLGHTSVAVRAHDSTAPIDEWIGQADRVICDVPCSGLGVIRKKPDLRYKDPASFAALPELQYDILSASADYLRPGGRLLYATCTILPAENGEVVSRFLAARPDFALVPFGIPGFSDTGGEVTLLPQTHATDGFYFALLERR